MTAVDYSLTGPSSVAAVEHGLANAEWFLPAVDPVTMRALQVREDRQAAVDTTIWLLLLVMQACPSLSASSKWH